MPTARLLLVTLLLQACGPEEDTGASHEPVSGEPRLTVDPASVTFEGLAPGEQTLAPVTLRNEGDGALHLSPLAITEAMSPFDVEPFTVMKLEPGEVAAAVITFTPVEVASYQGVLRIQSDDPERPVLDVPLEGFGLGGVLELTTGADDMGIVEVGCADDTSVTARNAGNTDLEITDWSLAAGSEEWSFTLEREGGSLPWVLAPGESLTLGRLTYAPMDRGSDSVALMVQSDEPLTGSTSVTVRGVGEYDNLASETLQLVSKQVDALLVVNGSSAMQDELAALTAAIPAFQEALTASTQSYQYAGITQAHCVSGPTRFIDDSFAPERAQSTFQTMILHAAELTYVVKMLDVAVYHVVRPAECNTGTLRDGHHWSLVGITDATDTSPEDAAYYIGAVTTKKGDADFSFHGIAGDSPSGCGGADFWGLGYELAGLTGGTTLSICTTDWDATMTRLARDLAENAEWVDTYPLADVPVAGTITVEVDGDPFEGIWSYDERDHAIVFDTFPAWDATIEVTYALPGDCP